MTKTPDRFPGEREDEGIKLDIDTVRPTVNGELRYVQDEGFKFFEEGVEKSLVEAGITEEQHKSLRHLIHLADGGGPFEGFASGAYRETTGTVFPSALIWWESSAKTHKIVEKLLAYSGPFPTTITWKAYDSVGLLATVEDTISYSGPFETSRTRTVTPESTGIPTTIEVVNELPVPTLALRGRFYLLMGDVLEEDKLFVCRKNDQDVYEMRVVPFV